MEKSKEILDRTYIRSHKTIRYLSEKGERVQFRIGALFDRALPRNNYVGKGVLFGKYNEDYEFLRGKEVYDALMSPFALEQLKEAARTRVDSETFRQTINDLLASSAFSEACFEEAA